MILIDFHVHTHYSMDALLTPRSLLQVAKKKGLDYIAVTDHGTTKGVKILQKMTQTSSAPRIIPGVEVMTSEGEIILLFEIDLPPLKGNPYPSASNVIDAARDIDAVITIPHPFDRRRKGLNPINIHNKIDVIETFNSRVLLPRYNNQAKNFAIKHEIPQSAGSDAHTPYEIGRALTKVLSGGDDLEEIRTCLLQGKTINAGRLGNPIYQILGWAWRNSRSKSVVDILK